MHYRWERNQKPAVLRGQSEIDGNADDSYRYVLMPVRLAG